MERWKRGRGGRMGEEAGEKARETWWGGVMGAGQVCALPSILTGSALRLWWWAGWEKGRVPTMPILHPAASFCPCFTYCSDFSSPFSFPGCPFSVPLLSSSKHTGFPSFGTDTLTVCEGDHRFSCALGKIHYQTYGHLILWSSAAAVLLWSQLIGSSQTTSWCLLHEPARRTFPLKL